MIGGRHAAARPIVVAVATLVLVSLLAPGVAAGQEPVPDDPALVVDLDADGDATVTLVSTYDLESDDEREAFEDLREDGDAREKIANRFADRMASIAADAAAATDRDMSVSDGSVEVRVDGDRGIVAVSVHWSGLAALDGDRLTVTEPFASGYESDRPLVFVAPTGATLADATPEPDRTDGEAATWDAGTDLGGFEATYELGEDAGGDAADDDAADDGLPGFGLVAGVLALAASLTAALARSRRPAR